MMDCMQKMFINTLIFKGQIMGYGITTFGTLVEVIMIWAFTRNDKEMIK